MNTPEVNVPVVLLVFNRPEETYKLFQIIKEIRPKRLFVVGDGPRAGTLTDVENCLQVRRIFDQIDWECDFRSAFSDKNMGCRKRVSSGIDWVFSLTDQAIFLEDDCLPDPSFFEFCQQMLDKYREDERIMAISGDNFQNGRKTIDDSYYFSIFPHCWGWATWKRAWDYYDDEMSGWNVDEGQQLLTDILGNRRAARDWSFWLQQTHSNKNDSWAYRWTWSCWQNSGLTILPKCNLVTNIGFGETATHTKSSFFLQTNSHPVADSIEFPLRHPRFVRRDWEADRNTLKFHFGAGFFKHYIRSMLRLIRRMRSTS